MVRLKNLPGESVISGYKGTIDYYYNMGIPCARRWPRSPGPRRAPAVEAQWANFAAGSRLWSTLTAEAKEPYIRLAVGSGLSSRDMFMRSYLTGLYRYPTGGEEEMKTILLDPEVLLFLHANINATVPWADLDLSANVPAGAAHVIVRHFLEHDGPMFDGWIVQYTRQKGGTTTRYSLAHKCLRQRGWHGMNDVIVSCDTDRKIQYQITITPGVASVYSHAYLIGFII